MLVGRRRQALCLAPFAYVGRANLNKAKIEAKAHLGLLLFWNGAVREGADGARLRVVAESGIVLLSFVILVFNAPCLPNEVSFQIYNRY